MNFKSGIQVEYYILDINNFFHFFRERGQCDFNY